MVTDLWAVLGEWEAQGLKDFGGDSESRGGVWGTSWRWCQLAYDLNAEQDLTQALEVRVGG